MSQSAGSVLSPEALCAPWCPRERIQFLSDVRAPSLGGEYVLLWVQQDVRAECNHALEIAIALANMLRLPLVAAYGLYEKFPGATERSFAFLLEGLCENERHLHVRGIPLLVGRAPPPDVVRTLAAGASAVVCDRGYTRVVRNWRSQLASILPCPLIQVETSVVVPVCTASRILEPAAATLRPKLMSLVRRFMQPVPTLVLQAKIEDMGAVLACLASAGIAQLDVTSPKVALAVLDVDRSVPCVSGFCGGTTKAKERLQAFAGGPLSRYREIRKDPAKQCQSQLSPYLHFGQISTLQIILWLRENAPSVHADAWTEELVVRRELARNMAYYAPDDYDRYEGVVPHWARLTLEAHGTDARDAQYTWSELELGKTADEAWNAAQHEMLASGHMHNYMRMYWCKQLLRWTRSPKEAFETAIRLNDRWELDGRDENGYMGVAWCFGNHDNEFPERPIFGTVRSMTRSGLKAKFDEAKYIEIVRKKCAAACRDDSRYVALLPRPKGLLSFFTPSKTPGSAGQGLATPPRLGKREAGSFGPDVARSQKRKCL